MSLNTTVNGIDVSLFQGTVNWSEVKASDIVFAFAKATQGNTFIDPQFAINWQGMKAAGLLRGAYHFYESMDDPVSQAQNFIRAVGGLDPTDLPPVLDIESFGGAYGSTDLVTNVQTWLDTVEKALDRTPMIYTNHVFWDMHMNSQFGRYPLWIAEYRPRPPTLPAGWSAWTFWQSSETLTTPGVIGNVDSDSYAGTYAELLTFLQKPAKIMSIGQ